MTRRHILEKKSFLGADTESEKLDWGVGPERRRVWPSMPDQLADGHIPQTGADEEWRGPRPNIGGSRVLTSEESLWRGPIRQVFSDCLIQ